MKIPEKLIEKYNIPVPRYTSYPPANFFSAEFNNNDYIRAIEVSNHEWPRIFPFTYTFRFARKFVITAVATLI
jgi:hypothetical protein